MKPNEITITKRATCIREGTDVWNVTVADAREHNVALHAGRIGWNQHEYEFYPVTGVPLNVTHLLAIIQHCVEETKFHIQSLEH